MLDRSRYLAPIFPLLVTCALQAAGPAPPMKVKDGFQVELVYQVDRDEQGSWVALTLDDQGRLLAADQFGGLYRVTLSERGGRGRAEKLAVRLGHAQGLLYAFDSLYAVVSEQVGSGPGLYRVRDTDGDDQFDQVQLLNKLAGTGEHGPHSIVLGPDGKSLYLCAGNKTRIPAEFLEGGREGKASYRSRVPRHWGEDDLLPRIWGPIGSEAGTPAPGGWVARTDPNGEHWELVAVGLRNAFDLCFNRHGDLFTCDADAEFDLGTPWYQPTRVFHVVSGADYGWRSGAGKWPPYYADTLPPAVDIGPGSPTGMAFGYGADFPAKYRDALFVGDWSFGRIFAVHLDADGASYRGEVEEFVSGVPLPVTDLLVHPKHRGLYFAVGGRRTTSAIYRVVFTGKNPAEDQPPHAAANRQSARTRAIRSKLETLHLADDPAVIQQAWPYLAAEDRFVRHAARIVLEQQPPAAWQERAFAEPAAAARLTALLGLSRAGEPRQLPKLLRALAELDWQKLTARQRLALLRAYELALLRMLPANDGRRAALLEMVQADLEQLFPAEDRRLNAELCKLLVFAGAAQAAKKGLALLEAAPTQQEQLRYALPLRVLEKGWTPELRKRYFSWLARAGSYRGGRSFDKYIEIVQREALQRIPADERQPLEDILRRARKQREAEQPELLTAAQHRPLVRKWKLDHLLPVEPQQLAEADPQLGRKIFAEAACFRCHRFGGEGGAVGPDLTGVAGRFSPRDLLESLLEPSKTVSDQFAATTIVTTDGKVITGRLVNLVGDTWLVQTDMLKPGELTRIPREKIDAIAASKVSMMPTGLLDHFTDEEIYALLAYLRSGKRRQPAAAGRDP